MSMSIMCISVILATHLGKRSVKGQSVNDEKQNALAPRISMSKKGG